METTPCNLCGSRETTPLYILPDYLLERDEPQTRLVKCRQCGLIYQNPRPTLAEIGKYYPPEYDSYTAPETKHTSTLMRWAVDYGLHKRCRFITHEKTSGRLLDVGCATGLFLRAMARKPGWTVQGVEISPHAAQVARQHGLEVFTGSLEQAAFPGNTFDAITLFDVLEHLHDPAASLAEIRRILKPGGILVLRIPDVKSLDAHLFGRYWAGLDTPRHLYVFDRQTAARMLEKSGLLVRRMSSGLGSYPTFVLSVRFWLVGRRTSPAGREAVQKLLSHPLARLFSAPFFYMVDLAQRSPQVVITAEKKG